MLLVFLLLTLTFVLLAIGNSGAASERHSLGRLRRPRHRCCGLVRVVRRRVNSTFGRTVLPVEPLRTALAHVPTARRCRVRPMSSAIAGRSTPTRWTHELAALLDVERFAPPEAFREQALLNDPAVYEPAAADPEAWWAEQAEQLHWFQKWEQVLDDSDPPFYKWFTGGTLNVSYNCLDRHVEEGRGERVAFHWRGEEGEERDITYAELLAEVQRFANALKDLGVEKGDVVGIYLPMIPEVVVAMLACARIGAPHNVVFGGFSRRGGPRAHGVLRGQGADHRRRRRPQGQDGAGQGQRSTR